MDPSVLISFDFILELSHCDIVLATMERGRVSDEVVKKATGKTWDSWFALLDKSGAKKMDHTEIANFLSTKHIPNGWWAQMVTVEYERTQDKRVIEHPLRG